MNRSKLWDSPQWALILLLSTLSIFFCDENEFQHWLLGNEGCRENKLVLTGEIYKKHSSAEDLYIRWGVGNKQLLIALYEDLYSVYM